MLCHKTVANITERGGRPLVFLQHIGCEALVVNLVEAGKGFRLLTIERLILVHIHNTELVFLLRKFAFGIGASLDFKEEPIAVASGVRIWADVEIELARLDLDGQVQVARLELSIENQVTLVPVLRIDVGFLQAIVNGSSGCLHPLKATDAFHALWNDYIIVLALLVIVVYFLAEA